MPRRFPPFALVLLLPLHIVLIFFTHKAQSQDTPIVLSCSGDNYPSPSLYESSLHKLLANLTASVPNSPSFYSTDNATVGFPSSHVFALAQCRPDSSSLVCADCLSRSTVMVTTTLGDEGCGRTISAIVIFDMCVLHYTNRSFDLSDNSYLWFLYNLQNSSSPTQFKLLAVDLLSRLFEEAATADSKFAVGHTEDGEQKEQRIYGLAWCMRNLPSYECEACLRTAMESLNYNVVGGRAMASSCVVRFELYVFFDLSFMTPSSSSEAINRSENNLISTSVRGGDSKTKVLLVITISEAVALVLLSTILILLLLRLKKMYMIVPIKENASIGKRSDGHLFLDLCRIRAATNNFSEENKLGKGGFGVVFRGILRDGEEIAVKRLSKTSLQGVQELENEVAFVAKLQHRNLVSLLGCCLEKEEKLLIYEFLPNKSLDKFLFDPVRRAQLDWGTRFKIIEGIAQGLIYLHEDSRLRVIHCDLKASNILLDSSMNPKISDFGFAKLFGINEAQRKTSRIAGTCGYMAPEYAMHGLFSTKSDVYSYGVLVLEIITGRTNICLDESLDSLDLLSYVWRYWKNGHALQALDQSLGDRYIPEQALRCIQIGLLCIQEDPAQRPSMASLVIMLYTSTITLPEPLMPAFLSFANHCSSIDDS